MGAIVDIVSEYSIGGINGSDMSEGGPLCWTHVPHAYRLKETLFGIVLGLCFLIYGLIHHARPSSFSSSSSHRDTANKRSLQVMTATLIGIFLVEIGYKVVSKQCIFLFMPCHLITSCQIFILISLLKGPPSLFLEYVFRIMLHFLHGPLTAILFPVTECLRLPYEAELYWIQHFFILSVVPTYLLKEHFNLSGPKEFSVHWSYLSYGIWMIIHWIPLQGVSLLSGANVGSMLCPASSDPFAGKYYRLFGIGHQFLSILLMGLLWSAVESYFVHPKAHKKSA